MQDFIAALLAILGTLLVLAGATVTVLKTMATAPATGENAGAGQRVSGWISRLNGADRLVAWGIVLLVLAAIASGALSFNFGAEAGTR